MTGYVDTKVEIELITKLRVTPQYDDMGLDAIFTDRIMEVGDEFRMGDSKYVVICKEWYEPSIGTPEFKRYRVEER